MDFGLLNSRKPQCTHLKMKTRTFTLCGSSEIVCVCVCVCVNQQNIAHRDLFQGFAHLRDSNKSSCIFATITGATLKHTKPACYGLKCVFPKMVKNLPANAGDASLISGWGRSPGGRHGNPLWYSCLENPMDRGSWRALVHGVSKSQT